MKLRLTPVTDPAVTILERFRSESDISLAETIEVVGRVWRAESIGKNVRTMVERM